MGCTAGHGRHDSSVVNVVLDGPHPQVPDYPAVPPRLRTVFPLRVWNWQKYHGTTGYCPGNDTISESIDTQGVWEGYGTNLVLDILDRPGPGQIVVDLGSQIGWYTMLAAVNGWPVLAVDADPETIRLLEQTVTGAGVHSHVGLCRACINDTTAPVDTSVPVRLLKVDIEGAENHAVRVFTPLFEQRLVSFVLMEISPCFDGYYPALCVEMMDRFGFDAYLLPAKNSDLVGFGTEPLRALRAWRLDRDTIEETVASWHQRDILFVSGGLGQWL